MPDLEGGYEVIYDTQLQATSSGGPFRAGQVVVHRSGTDRLQWALAKWVKFPHGISRGEVAVTDFSQTVESSVTKASTTDSYSPGTFRGVAGGSVASGYYGFSVISGYCEQVYSSETAASGEGMTISGSTAGQLTPNRGSSFWTATVGVSSQLGTAPFLYAVARGAFATGLGSIQILGTWA